MKDILTHHNLINVIKMKRKMNDRYLSTFHVHVLYVLLTGHLSRSCFNHLTAGKPASQREIGYF